MTPVSPPTRARLFPIVVVAMIASIGANPVAPAAASDLEVIPLPRHGDVALYRVHFGTGSAEPDSLAFTWNGTADYLDTWSGRVMVDVVEWRSDAADFLPYSLGFLGGDSRAYVSDVLDPRFGGEWTDGVLLPMTTANETRLTRILTYDPEPEPGHCLARSGWQGMDLDAIAGRSPGELCPALSWLDAALSDEGTVRAGDVEARRFTASNGTAGLVLDVVAGVPYPLRLSFSRESGSLSFELSGIEAGEGAALRPSEPRPTGSRDPALFGAYGRLGPSEEGVPGWRLSEAAAIVEEDESLREFQEWRRKHPDARLAEATHLSWEFGLVGECDAPSTARRTALWVLTWRDGGGESVLLTTAYRSEPCGYPPSVRGLLPPDFGADYMTGEMPPTSPRNPLPDSSVRGLTLAGTLRLFDELRLTRDAPPNAWGFDVDVDWLTGQSRETTWAQVTSGRPTDSAEEYIVFAAATGEITKRAWTVNASVETSSALPLVGGFLGSSSADAAARGSAVAPGGGDAAALAALGVVGAVAAASALVAAAPAAVAAYSRIARSDLLANPKRAALVAAVRASPGIAFGELIDATGLGKGAVSHHASVLVRAGLLARVRAGGFTRFFLPGALPTLARDAAALERSAGAEARVLAVARAAPGVHAAEVARRLGVSRVAVHHALVRLERRGLLERRREGRRVLLYPRGRRSGRTLPNPSAPPAGMGKRAPRKPKNPYRLRRPRMHARLVMLAVVALLVPGCLNAVDSDAVGSNASDADLTPVTSVRERAALPFVTNDEFSRTLEAGAFAVGTPLSVSVAVDLPVGSGLPSAEFHMGVFLPEIPGCDFTAADLPAECKVPVVGDAGPYYGDGDVDALTPAERLGRFLIENLVPHGYAVAQISVFGTGKSGGCMDLMGEVEQAGVQAAVEWLGTQPWSNGNVALIGRSYDGSTPWEAAMAGSEHLKTVVPISGLIGQHELMWRNGSAELRAPGLLWGIYFLDAYMGEDDPALQARQAAENSVCPDSLTGGAQAVAAYATGDKVAPAANGYFTERSFWEAVLENYEGSVYFIHGLEDWNVDPHMIAPFYQKLEAKGLEVKGLFGQWAHNYPDRLEEHESCDGQPELCKAPYSVRHDWAQDLLEWFDHYLKGTGAKPELHVEIQGDDGRWRIEESFPPRDLAWSELPFGEALALQTEEPALVAPATGFLGIPPLQRDVVLQSEPLAADTIISGLPQLHVTVTPAGAGGQLYAELRDAEDGRHIGHAIMDLRYAAGGEEMQPVVPGQPLVARMEFFPLDAFVPAGHKLELRISATGWDYMPSAVSAPVLAHVGPESVLRLPVVERGEDAFFAPPGVTYAESADA